MRSMPLSPSIGRARGLVALAADLAHRARSAFERIALVNFVLQLFVADRFDEHAGQVSVGDAVAQRTAQVPLVDGEQTGAELAVGSQADAIAGAAEGLRDGVDEA